MYSSVMQAANQEDDCRNLFIRNLPFNATSDHLKEAFQPFGTLVDCTVVYDRQTRASKGYGFVKYDNARSALRAIDADISILGNSINKNFACLRSKSPFLKHPFISRQIYLLSCSFRTSAYNSFYSQLWLRQENHDSKHPL